MLGRPALGHHLDDLDALGAAEIEQHRADGTGRLGLRLVIEECDAQLVAVAVGVRAEIDARPVSIAGQEVVVGASAFEQLIEGREVELLEANDVDVLLGRSGG